MTKAIYFDMDGTIADLYSVENWLPKLRAHDASPYMDAKPLVNLSALARRLHQLQREGYHIGIVSWQSKDPDVAYGEAVSEAKRAWLARHMPSVMWDEIKIVPYGTPKPSVVEYPQGILFDDEKPNREAWRRYGKAFDVNEILSMMRSF